MPTVRDMLGVCLEDHQRMNPGERHGPEWCSWCLLFAALAIVAQAAKLLESEARAVQPVVGASDA